MDLRAIVKEEKRTGWSWLGHVTIALASTLLWLLFSSSDSGEKYEFMVHDALVSMRGARPSPQDVVVVALDEGSYDAWQLPMDRPIPRDKYAKLIRRLAELGAQRVIFDVVFVGRSSSTEADNELSEALEAMPVVLGVDHGIQEVNGEPVHEVIKPDPFLAGSAAALGLVTMPLDQGVARRFLVDRSEHVSKFLTLSEAGAGYLTKAALDMAHRPTAHDLINYYGPAGSIRTFSMYQVLEEIPPPRQLFVGKQVFVGLSLRTGLGADFKDRFLTPFKDVFGVEIHATMAANLINKDWIRRASPNSERLIGGILVFLSCFLIMLLPPLAAALSTVAMAGLWVAGAYAALHMDYFLTGGSAVLGAIPVVFLANTTYNYLVTLRSQRQIEKAFSHYLSPEIINELKRNPQLLKLGGDEVVATAMFTDIEGFTTISEMLGAKGVAQMLNMYFTDVSKAVMDEGGTVIKFIGDAVFAIWGAPVPFEDHAARACRAAIRIQKTVEAFNESGLFPPLVTRVGLNTGEMVVGNLGSDKRFDYTAIGDSVNLAARVEGVNKYMGTTILVTEDALAHAGIDVRLLPMGAIRVVGKLKPVRLYRLATEETEPAMRAEWERALELWTNQRWTEAKACFQKILATYPDLAVAAQTYLHAISEFEQESPGSQWEGELVMEHK